MVKRDTSFHFLLKNLGKITQRYFHFFGGKQNKVRNMEAFSPFMAGSESNLIGMRLLLCSGLYTPIQEKIKKRPIVLFGPYLPIGLEAEERP